jgi:hypothetical protein
MYVSSVLVCTKDILVSVVCNKFILVYTWLYCTDPCITGFSGARRDANMGGPMEESGVVNLYEPSPLQ